MPLEHRSIFTILNRLLISIAELRYEFVILITNMVLSGLRVIAPEDAGNTLPGSCFPYPPSPGTGHRNRSLRQ